MSARTYFDQFIWIFVSGGVAKLTDFGMATYCRDSRGEIILCEMYCGTVEYQAPETLLCEEPYDGIAADCFSLGVLLYVLNTGKFPFGQGRELQTPEAVNALHARIKAKQWPRIGAIESDHELRSLLLQLLNPEVDERVQSAQVLSHQWIAD